MGVFTTIRGREGHAIQIGRELEQLGVAIFEEPISSDADEGCAAPYCFLRVRT